MVGRCFGGGGGGNLLRYGVRITQRAPVEIIGDALPARGVIEGTAFARDGEEGHEACPVEVARRILGGVVGHHARREGVAGGGDEDAGELREEEVGVRGNGVVELRLAEGEEGGVLLRSGLGGLLAMGMGGRFWWGWMLMDGRLAVFSRRAS